MKVRDAAERFRRAAQKQSAGWWAAMGALLASSAVPCPECGVPLALHIWPLLLLLLVAARRIRPSESKAMKDHSIIILPTPGCRRSRKVIEYLEAHHIPFTRIELESPEGQALTAQYDLRASPGIIVDGVSVNPFDLLSQPECQVNEEKASAIFIGVSTNQNER